MTGALLVAFLIYVYFPHIFFRVWVERYVDLGRRKDVSQFEEIISTILPASVFHLQALCVIWILTLPDVVSFPGPDWKLLLSLHSPAGYSRLAEYLSDPFQIMWPVAYFVILLAVTFVNGVGFGRGIFLGFHLGANPKVYPNARAIFTRHNRGGYFIKVVLPGVFFWFWKLTYQENFIRLFQWNVLRPFVFVKTKDGYLFHGRYEDYDKDSDGNINGVFLTKVSRFTRQPLRDALRSGENPIRSLEGILYLKWSEVSDINTTNPGEIGRIWRRYEEIRRRYATGDNASPLAG